MKKFALIENAIVKNIIVADDNFINGLPNKNDYVEYTNAGIGWSYDGVNFLQPQPYLSWTLDNDLNWQAPTPRPTDGSWYWDEPTLTWVESTIL